MGEHFFPIEYGPAASRSVASGATHATSGVMISRSFIPVLPFRYSRRDAPGDRRPVIANSMPPNGNRSDFDSGSLMLWDEFGAARRKWQAGRRASHRRPTARSAHAQPCGCPATDRALSGRGASETRRGPGARSTWTRRRTRPYGRRRCTRPPRVGPGRPRRRTG